MWHALALCPTHPSATRPAFPALQFFRLADHNEFLADDGVEWTVLCGLQGATPGTEQNVTKHVTLHGLLKPP